MEAAKSPNKAVAMDLKAKKHVLRLIPYGLYVLTAGTSNRVSAATVSWLSQVSFEPPRLAVALRRDTGVWHRVHETGAFVVNVLGTGQKEIAARFFRHAEVVDSSIGGCPFHQGALDVPILDDLPGYLECRVVESLDAGDHTLFVADIVQAGIQNELDALTLGETPWHYGG